ncbi:Fungalysin metallopeptidase-domain-containing protein [Mycena sp. CBHHK59/15]|nr:Fungalysin metallopeptidase-domain-containing protein [Mycena sp. CBHHK59/15]
MIFPPSLMICTQRTTNPLRYSDVETLAEDQSVHKIGEVWANILHNINAALVEKYGFSTSAMTNPDGTEGNIIFLHLFIDAMALQPTRPTFVFARQAWIQADANRYNGANQSILWKVFASRGLGVGAADYVDSALLPSHFKPVIVERGQTKLPPLVGGYDGGVAYGSIVSVSINPQTIVTIFGIVTASWKQKVKPSYWTHSPSNRRLPSSSTESRRNLCALTTNLRRL